MTDSDTNAPGDSFRWTATDGLGVHVHAWLPAAAPRAVIHVAHGMGEHAARYARFAASLNRAGYAVYANDHRGHGETAITDEGLGDLGSDGWHAAVVDLHGMILDWKQRHPGVPVVLFGHSMGSLLAQHYLVRYGETLSGACLSGSTGDAGPLRRVGRWVARMERWRVGATGHSRLLDAMLFGRANRPFRPARTDFDWLSRDAREVDEYVGDPRCGFALSAGSFADMLDGLGELAKPEIWKNIPEGLPILVFSGEQDPIHEKGRGFDKLLAQLGRSGAAVSSRLYTDGRHEMLNEENRDEVTADFIDWVDRAVCVQTR